MPLLRPASPLPRSMVLMVRRPPRFGTSCQRRWLPFDMSIGFTSWNVAVYRTLPSGSFPSSMSWTMALSGFFGSSSPKARPRMISNWPALPKDGAVCPARQGLIGDCASQNAGDVFESMTIFVTFAWDGGAQASSATASATSEGRLPPSIRGNSGLMWGFSLPAGDTVGPRPVLRGRTAGQGAACRDASRRGGCGPPRGRRSFPPGRACSALAARGSRSPALSP